MKKKLFVTLVCLMSLTLVLSAATDVKITYVNNSMNVDRPTIFVFTKNMVPTFDTLKHGVAWKVLPDIGRGSSYSFVYPNETFVQATWGDGNTTPMIPAVAGKRYSVEKDKTGIILKEAGPASQPTAIEVNSSVQVRGGVTAQITKDGKVLMSKKVIVPHQKATFILHLKLYWGIASEIQEGQALSSAVLNTGQFFEQDIEGVKHAVVTLQGNAKDGYKFVVENRE